MKKSKTRYLSVLLALALLLCLIPATPALAATTWYVDDDGGADFTSIADAVAAAGAGDTIIVKDGTYNESVININQAGLILRSENGPDAVTINKTSTVANEGLFEVYKPQVTIDGFTMKAQLSNQSEGIHTREADGTNGFYTFTNNVLERFYVGIDLFRAYVGNSTISNNEIVCNGIHEIPLAPTGIEVRSSSDNVITDNTIIESLHRVDSIGITIIWEWDTKPCINNTVSGNTVDNFDKGIWVWGSQENNIFNNNITGNSYGIYLMSSLYSPKTENNIFFANNIISSTVANVGFADTNTLTNYWNSLEEMEYWYDGASYSGYLGNYWGGYSGTDADGDGIGDTPYQTRTSPAEFDNYPLMEPAENYSPGSCGDADGDGTVTMNDGRQIFMYLIYGDDDYPINPLAADCDGEPGITMNDGRQIFMYLIYGGDDYPLQCSW
jgi:parallel beta-helix repeat protein